jgi:hypothetical protein
MRTKSRLLNALLDSAALTIALVVDLILNVICMIIIAPGPLEAIGFAAIACVVVLFAVRSWVIGNKVLWAVFALVSVFFDLSFTLIATDVQTSSQSVIVSADTDSELQYLSKKAETAGADLRGLRDQYRMAMKRETMDQLDKQIKEAERVFAETEAARSSRLQFIESGGLREQTVRQRATITAAMIFGAILASAQKGRVIPLVIFLMIFSGLQLVMVTAADAVRGKIGRRKAGRLSVRKPREPDDRIRALVDIWVHTSWIGRRTSGATSIIDHDSFMTFIRNQGHTFPARQYSEITAAARTAGVIDGMGVILERDEGKAAERILKNLLTKGVKSDTMGNRQSELF